MREPAGRVAGSARDPATDAWTSLPVPPISTMHSIAGTIGKKFYATGSNGQVAVYDPVTNSWTSRTATGDVPFNAAGLPAQAKLFALNLDHGNPDGTITTSIRVYDPAIRSSGAGPTGWRSPNRNGRRHPPREQPAVHPVTRARELSAQGDGPGWVLAL